MTKTLGEMNIKYVGGTCRAGDFPEQNKLLAVTGNGDKFQIDKNELIDKGV